MVDIIKMLTKKKCYPNKNNAKFIVIHETDNEDKGADAKRHAQALNNVFTIGVAYKMEEPIEPPTKPIKPGTGGVSDKLPQTGGIINGTSLMVLGAVAIGTGFVMNRKSEEKGGGKHNE